MPAVWSASNFFVNEKRCIDEIVIFDCFCWNSQSVKGYVVMLGSTGWSWPWAVAAVAVTVVMAFSASIFKQRKRRKQLCKKRNAQVTSTHTQNEHETWRYPLRKDTKRHLQTRAKPFWDCFQVGFLFKRVSTYLSESNPIVLQLVTVLRADLWQKIQDFSVRLRKRRFFVRL